MCTKDIIVSTARQNFKNAEKALRECDDIYANDKNVILRKCISVIKS